VADQNGDLRAWITGQPDVAEKTALVADVVRLMADRRVGALPIVDRGKLVGIFTERDLLKVMSRGGTEAATAALHEPVERFMTPSPVTASARESFDAVYLKMKTLGVRHIPVVEGERVVGIVSMRDLLHLYQNKLESAYLGAQKQLDELKEIVRLSPDERLSALIEEIRTYREQSLTDYLTGLYNKRYFQGRLTEEVARARRYGERLSLVFCDLDHFKRVNDTYGHEEGDEVLRHVARILAGTLDEITVLSRLRKSDIVARYGGEEFVAILPETDERGACLAAEKMRKAVETHPFRIGAATVEITMSLGVAELADDVQDARSLIERADHAMYLAKSGGRNRVVAHSGGAAGSPASSVR
jgi:diguanylate cyclase (GGDEF)-like protein